MAGGSPFSIASLKEYVLPAAIIGLLGYSLYRNLKTK
jgi:hypothetical protein